MMTADGLQPMRCSGCEPAAGVPHSGAGRMPALREDNTDERRELYFLQDCKW